MYLFSRYFRPKTNLNKAFANIDRQHTLLNTQHVKVAQVNAYKRHASSAESSLCSAVDNLCQKVRGVLIADITFNMAGGGAVMGTLHRKSGDSQPSSLPAAPNGNICFEPEIMEIIWPPLHLNKSDPQWSESAQVVMGPLNIHRRLLPCKSIIIWACDQRVSSFTLRRAAPLFVAAPLVCNYSCSHIGDSHTIVLQFSAARAHTLTHSRSNTKLVVSLFTGRKRTVSRRLTLSGRKYPNNAN